LTVLCPNCGRVNRPGARYCASCQTPLSVVAARLQPEQRLERGAYRIVRALGKGGMGAVWLVAQTKAFDRLAVLKEVIDYFDPTDAQERLEAAQRFEAEARTLGDLRHPGIPDLYAFFSEGGHNYLVMEYIEGPDLRYGLTREDTDTGELIPGGPLRTEQVLHYTMQICEVLAYLATQVPPVVHNDIKPGNIIIGKNSGRAVLVDFGTAKTRYLQTAGGADGKKASIYGTVGYAAPELYQGHSEPRSDVFSLAATAYHLLTDDDPRDHPFQYPLLDMLPPALADLLRAALAEEIQDRPSAGELREQLEGYLAGQSAPLLALTFPGGDSAETLDDLVALAAKHWRHAANLLQDGTIARWLQRTIRDQGAARAAEEATRQWPANPDAALDAFVRKVDPTALPAGKLELRTTSLRLRGVNAGQRIGQQIEVANTGRGYLQGELDSTQPWVRAASTFGCPPGRTCTVPIEVDTTGLLPGQPYLAAVTLQPNNGRPEVVAVQVSISGADAPPVKPGSGDAVIRVSVLRVDFGTVSAKKLSTPARRLTVTNKGKTACQVRILGAPRWLLVTPESFVLVPGAGQLVKLIGRIDKVEGRKQQVKLTVAPDGGKNQDVKVLLKVKRGGLFG